MAVKLTLAPEAERDVADAYDWYEARRPGLGDEFLGCVEACLEAIRRNPDSCTKIYKEFRRRLTRRFPYAIFFEENKNTVTIYGVLHTSRDPAKWRWRMA